MGAKHSNQGKVVVITGASSGIGRGLAERLAHEQVKLVIAARRTRLIEELANSLGPLVIPVTADVSRVKDVESLHRAAMHNFGRIDVWINNAGIGVYGPFIDTPLRDLNRTVEVNMLGTIYGSHFALRRFKEQRHGILINVSSFASKVPMPYGAAYTGSKFGVSGLSNGLYEELRLEDYPEVHICSIDPWITDTPWTEHAANYSGHEILVGPPDDPAKVIDAIIGLIDDPKKNLEVGGKGKATAIFGQFLPAVAKGLGGQELKEMIESAPAAGLTSGSLHEPVEEGRGVSGDLRERFEQQEEQ
ncbi:SDR family NAD(P)-dependent oxidoreductase [Planococcus sp. CP5-4]|uniref:SDR family NAD(P)-dependent oxidoreductase n=1 Tax=unclassified Planococcus (in: firmicutes) TaxID=2662419 RepID=UPI001C2176D7|nr:SDR family NAD(P)-dependent oxidoreductase [Planococcus sp. CP5-4]MBU9673299.1 SDR family NAD(P)-dependent oxidoreductase [Planococcus sp. CP5-4_YE]MBV0908393.1 SDR family NAD(P)-dependent oxidoreductase [Planococcus sp. CP5-4_UN]MBW6062607.1 SDR family NAD(P)-dependent oxidoreductase [Planococcus sp. CP5-4]